MILGKLLKEASKNLELYDSHQGFKFLAAKREIGRDNIIPNTVDTNAILRVSIRPIQAVEQVKSNNG